MKPNFSITAYTEKILSDLTASWLWPQRPVVLRHVGINDKTYFGFVSNEGKAYIASYDHDTEQYQSILLYDYGAVDDHNEPSILVRTDGKIVVFFCGHNADNIRWVISTSPEDISSFGEIKLISNPAVGGEYSYPQPIRLSAEGKIYLFCRRYYNETDRVWDINVSTDECETFVRDTNPLIHQADIFSPYTIPISNGIDTIWFARSDRLDSEDSYIRKHILAWYYKQGSFYKADGTKICDWVDLPITDLNDLDMIYNSDTPGNHYAFVSDIALDIDGKPAIAFTTLDNSNVNYCNYAKWNGLTWDVSEIVNIDGNVYADDSHPAYNGGIMLNHKNVSEVILGRETGGFGSKVFEIEIWKFNEVWEKTEDVSLKNVSLPKKIMRPYIPINHHPNFKAIWIGGVYTSYTNWSCNLFRRNKRPLVFRAPSF